jgi:hypothetical protein
MGCSYLASSAFDARREAFELIARFASPRPDVLRLRTVLDAIHSLDEASDVGFNGICFKWEKTGYEDLFLYFHAGILAALDVTGGGRGQTFDLTLIGVAYAAETSSKVVENFLTEMDNRRRTGVCHGWPRSRGTR